jgi:antitoxin component YwqK of YwqJK toxin-antitoxin module
MKKNIILSILFAAGSWQAVNAQKQTVHLNSLMQVSASGAPSYRLELMPTTENHFSGVVYDIMENKKAEGEYLMVGKKYLEDGQFRYYHANGNIESEGEFVRGVKVGSWRRYDPNGKQKPDRYYPVEAADMIRSTMQMEKIEDEKTTDGKRP